MDYILRDCKYTGIRFSFELDTILNNTFIQDNEIVFSEKARCSIDSFFHTRYSLYKQICNHPTVIALEHHMKEVLTLADPVLKITSSIKYGDWESFCKLTDDIFSIIEYLYDPRLDQAKQILNDIKTRNILKLVGGIVSNKELDIVSKNENVIVIKTKIKYHSYSLPNYLSNKRVKTNCDQKRYPDEYIIKVMCKDPDDSYALSLLKFD